MPVLLDDLLDLVDAAEVVGVPPKVQRISVPRGPSGSGEEDCRRRLPDDALEPAAPIGLHGPCPDRISEEKPTPN